MKKLALASNLSLPLDAITQRFAELGRIGSGKSYAATKLAELMLEAGAQVVAIDPVGVWYGLRVDGKGRGFPIPVFGGLHGDVPLESTAGAMIADLVVSRALSCVIDVSQFESDAAKARFAGDFAKRFFFLKKGSPSAVHLFLEECQEFVPQNPARGEEVMLHEWTRMAKLGRNFGIGLSLISQRPQEVNKKVLNLTECLLAFQMTGKLERDAIRDWVVAKGADVDLIKALPHLKVGDAYLYSPQWLEKLEKVRVLEKRSADVSSTPTFGAAVVATKPLTPVDLAELRTTMAATIEKAKADDPRELRKRIAELEREGAKKTAPVANIKVTVDEPMVRRLIDQEARKIRNHIGERDRRLKAQVDALGKTLGGIPERLRILAEILAEDATAGERVTTQTEPYNAPAPERHRATRQSVAPRAPVEGISKGQQKILNALAELEALGFEQTNRVQLGMFAGYNLTGGSGAQHIADLSKAGLVEIPEQGAVRLTTAGRDAADPIDAPSTLGELHERVYRKISDGQRRILAHLITIHPEAISRADLGKEVNYNLTGGSGAQHVADLINAGAAVIPAQGKVAASDFLFPKGLR